MKRFLTIAAVAGSMVVPGVAARAGGGGLCHNESATERTGISVMYQNFCPTPTILHVRVGQTVTWKNLDDLEHTVTSGLGGWAMETLSPNQTFSHRFDVAGNYTYYCMLHPNMGGVIQVGEVTSSGPVAATAAKQSSSNLGIAGLTGVLGLVVGGTSVGLRARKRTNGSGGQQP
jgi:plastocyanin